MTEIIDGKILRLDQTENARGGTELMAERMVRDIHPELLNKVQIIHSRVREVKQDRPTILVCHDLAEDPEMAQMIDPLWRKQFALFVFVSYHQAEQYRHRFKMDHDEYIVVQNGIEPFNVVEKTRDKVNIIYHTTPHRGLELVVPVFEILAKSYPDIHLDVYSSFQIYGWEQRNAAYQHLFDKCEQHPQITYHGTKSNEEVREALQQSHIFAYPSIWEETSCLALIEAICAGCVSVHPDFGALPETSKGCSLMYRYSDHPDTHFARFHSVLKLAIDEVKKYNENNQFIGSVNLWQNVANRYYNWYSVAKNWEFIIHQVIQRHGTATA